MKTPRTITLDQVYANTVYDRRTRCRLWQGTVKKRNGLPQVGLNGRKVYVTRLVWELVNGKLPPGHSVVHVHQCEYSNCVNEAHLLKVRSEDAWRYRKNNQKSIA